MEIKGQVLRMLHRITFGASDSAYTSCDGPFCSISCLNRGTNRSSWLISGVVIPVLVIISDRLVISVHLIAVEIGASVSVFKREGIAVIVQFFLVNLPLVIVRFYALWFPVVQVIGKVNG